MKALTREALSRSYNKRYAIEMKSEGVSETLKFGVAFSGKKAVVIP